MTSIVVYSTDPNLPTAQSKRIAGMMMAGDKLKTAFSAITGGLDDAKVEAAVVKVIGDFAASGSGFEPVLEHLDNGLTNTYTITPGAGNFDLTNKAVPTDTRKLKLDGKVDTFDSNQKKYKMTTVAPRPANSTAAWEYLYKTVYLDLKAINASGDDQLKTVNYLIATFAFTRCR